MLKANSHIVRVKKKKSSVKSDFPHHWLFHSPIIHFWNTFLSQAQCGHPGIPRKNLLLCIMRDIRIWPFHCRWNICIKFLQVFIIAIFSNICNCAHFSLDWLSFHRWQLWKALTYGNYTAQFVWDCKSTNSLESSVSACRPFPEAPLLQWRASKARKSLRAKRCQWLWFYPDFYLHLEDEGTFWTHSGNPLGLYLPLYMKLAPGRVVTPLLGQIINILFRIFFLLPPPSLYLSSWGPVQAVPSGLSEQFPAMLRRGPSLALSLGWHGGPWQEGAAGQTQNTHWASKHVGCFSPEELLKCL